MQNRSIQILGQLIRRGIRMVGIALLVTVLLGLIPPPLATDVVTSIVPAPLNPLAGAIVDRIVTQLPAPSVAHAQTAPTFGSVATAVDGGSPTGVTINQPTGTATNDLLLAAIATDSGDETISAPAGWTQIDQGNSGATGTSDISFALFYKLATASEPASYTFSWAGGEDVSAAILRYVGVDASNPIHASASAIGSSYTPTAPSVTTTEEGTLVVRIFASDDDESPVLVPTGHTGRVDIESNSGSGGESTLAVADVTQNVVGATGTGVFDLDGTTSNEKWRAVTVVLQAAPPVPGQINGLVFLDTDLDGSNNDESGIEHVDVTAYDAAGNSVAATTDASGAYLLDSANGGPSALSGEVRIEFRLPTDGSLDHLKPTIAGGTTIQFADMDAGASVSTGFHIPANYCQSNPDVYITCFVLGPYNGTFTAKDAVVHFPFTRAGDTTPPTFAATHGAVGTTHGLAYHRDTATTYVAAFDRRGTGFGPSGPGGIYAVDGAGTVSAYATIPNAGADNHDFSRAIEDEWYDSNYAATDNEPNTDGSTGVYPYAGKNSLGDMELSLDESTLYVVNMADQKLYSLPAASATVPVAAGNITEEGDIAAVDLSATGYNCPADEIRPMGLGINERTGDLYVGAVCSRESQNTDNPLPTPHGYVLRYDGSGSFTSVFDFAYDWDLREGGGQAWQPWSDTVERDTSGSLALTQALHRFTPLIADIEFDGDDLILGMRSRSLDQGMGRGNRFTRSDVVRACWNSGTSTWALESGGVCGGVTGAQNGTNHGPGDAYWYDLINFEGENTMTGSFALHPNGELIAGMNDALTVRSAGTVRYSASTPGEQLTVYQIFEGDWTEGLLGKTSGLGDMELACAAAPLEIGNRVWFDEDSDGIQDPQETPLLGVTVTLHDDSGTQIASAETDANGAYTFISGDDPRMSTIYATTTPINVGVVPTTTIVGGLLPNTAYEIRIDTTQAALTGYELTTANVDGGSTLPDAVDSDGILSSTDATISLTTSYAGSNDHTFDVGFAPPVPTVAVEKILNTPDPVLPGATVTFTIRITNTGTTTITTLPLTDTYNATYLTYISLRTTPEADTAGDTGQILWSDLTQNAPNGFGQDLGPGDVFDVVVEFVAALDTTSLPNGWTVNTAQVMTHTVTDPVTDTVRIYNPTGVVLINREVTMEADDVVLSWSTLDETELIGFHVMYIDTQNGGYISLTDNTDMIVAEHAGRSAGADYVYRMKSEMDAGTHYVLALVMANGTQQFMDMGTQRLGSWMVYLPVLRK
ncbi:MAG: SdrD B-like domain-containing protein [Chloroflexota bacterium]